MNFQKGREFQGEIHARIAELKEEIKPLAEKLRPKEKELELLQRYDQILKTMIAGGDPWDREFAQGASSPNNDLSKPKTKRREVITEILSEAGHPLTTNEICDKLRAKGDSYKSDSKAFWRTIDAVLRRGVKPPANCFRKVGSATWDLVRPAKNKEASRIKST